MLDISIRPSVHSQTPDLQVALGVTAEHCIELLHVSFSCRPNKQLHTNEKKAALLAYDILKNDTRF